MRCPSDWATCFATSGFYSIHAEITTLLTLAGWKPWETKALPVRERKYWAAWYEAVEEKRRMDQVTQPAG